MSYTNETMPEWQPRVQIDLLRFKTLEMEKAFWAEQYMVCVRKLENMVDACKDYGYVEIEWGSKKFKFTMEEIK
jgi:hypothetical protein